MKVRLRIKIWLPLIGRSRSNRTSRNPNTWNGHDLKRSYDPLVRSIILERKTDSKVIALTSTSGGEGVSYVALSLAQEIAEKSWCRVLVADAVALQAAQPEQVCSFCVPSAWGGVSVLPRKRKPLIVETAGDGEPLGLDQTRNAVRGCLKRLQRHYSYVLIDTSSLLASKPIRRVFCP